MTALAPIAAETTALDALRTRDDAGQALAAADPVADVGAAINAAFPAGGAFRVRGFELHLIRALNTVELGKGPEQVVAFAPEFLYVADVGKPARAGVSVYWENGAGLGDPRFPDFTKAKLRSVRGAAPHQLIYPDVAGQLLLGVDPAADPAAVRRDLEAAGLTGVAIRGPSGEARCAPFEEREVAARLTGTVPGLRYAEPNSVIRAGELNPGWAVRRIA